MSNFQLYAKYYDLLYEDKDYTQEVNYLMQLASDHGLNSINSILDLGCGTGKHAAEFSNRGIDVVGVDLSEQMISMANSKYRDNKRLKFFEGDLKHFRTAQRFDLVTSLFHVMSYQTSNNDLDMAIDNAGRHLNKDGLFIFDFWFGPAVLHELPEEREKLMSNAQLSVKRKATPVLHVNRNMVDVNYHIEMTEASGHSTEIFREQHRMRYLFIPEIKYMLHRHGFELLANYKWLSMDEPNLQSWNAVVVAKKN